MVKEKLWSKEDEMGTTVANTTEHEQELQKQHLELCPYPTQHVLPE